MSDMINKEMEKLLATYNSLRERILNHDRIKTHQKLLFFFLQERVGTHLASLFTDDTTGKELLETLKKYKTYSPTKLKYYGIQLDERTRREYSKSLRLIEEVLALNNQLRQIMKAIMMEGIKEEVVDS